MPSGTRPRLLVVSQLDMMRGGNQIMARSLRGYVAGGYDVHLVTAGWVNGGAQNRADPRAVLGEAAEHVTITYMPPRAPALLRIPGRFLVDVRSRLLRAGLDGATPGVHGPPEFNFDPEHVATFHEGGEYATSLEGLAFFALEAYLGARTALAAARQTPPDLIMGYEVFGIPGAYLAAQMLRRPLVTKFQGTIVGGYLDLHRLPLRLLEQLAALRMPSEAVFMENDGTRGDEVLRRVGVPDDRVHFWLDGVRQDLRIPDFERAAFLRREGLAQGSAPPKMLFCSSALTYWKRVDRAITALAALAPRHSDAVLVIPGEGSTRQALEAHAQRLRVADRVRFLGSIPHDRVREYLNATDVFVSLYDQSNMSNSVMEAMVAGTCIVSIDDGSTSALLRNGHNAVLVPRGSVGAELPRALDRLLDDPPLRHRLGQEALATSQAKLESWEVRMQREVAVLDSVLRRTRP